MTDNGESKKIHSKEQKKLSRREFITGTSSGAVSYGVFGNPMSQVLSLFAPKIDDPIAKQEQNKRMLEQAKRKSPT